MSRYGLPGFDGGEPAFAIGSVTGARWWNLADGHLTGVHGTWLMGENAARCSMSAGKRDHVTPDEDCGCGFWAYWTAEDHQHGFQFPVLGVIEGYGKTLIGERGFRCAKARIIALHIPAGPRLAEFGVPDCLRGKSDGAIATWRALAGRRHPRKLTPDEVLLYIAVLEMQLEETYGVPVYSTAGLMLARHPPTPDYLPPSARPVTLPGKPGIPGADALAILQAKAQPGSDE